MAAVIGPGQLSEDGLTAVFAALANTTRRSILDHLTRGAATVNELAEPLSLSLPAVSRHLKVLEHAGLIVRGRRAQFRPCAIDAAPIEAVSGWTEQYRPIWEARFDRMDDHLAELAALQTNSSTHPDNPKD